MEDQDDKRTEHDSSGNNAPLKVLTLDGGGAKGFYAIGVLRELEAMLDSPLYKNFDLVFGTSTGAIIAALIALGYTVDQIHNIYNEHVPSIMKKKSPQDRTQALRKLANEVFKDSTFEQVKTGIGIVATKWTIELPMIFKASVDQVHGRKGTFSPGFGVSIADAVEASCSAYPLFERKTVTTSAGDKIELIDGGYCANNPTLYAIADAKVALNIDSQNMRILNVGVGVYPEPNPSFMKHGFIMRSVKKYSVSLQLLQKTLEINTHSMDQLRRILFMDVPTIRISDTFEKPEVATDLMESNLDKLNLLHQLGRESFASREVELRKFLM